MFKKRVDQAEMGSFLWQYYTKGKGGRNANNDVKSYVSNTTICRRKLLFKKFLMYSESDINVSGCKCCDVCETSCTCVLCSQSS